MEHLPRRAFTACVARYDAERYAKRLSCREQFFAMAFGQLSYRESLRDVVACLSAHREKLYHLGFRTIIARQTLARANERRDWRIWRDLALSLIDEARALYVDEPDLADDITGSCYCVDSTSIELCLSLFHWAPYVSTKVAVKLHLGLDIRGSIPAFFDFTSGKVNDVNFLDHVVFETGAFYIMDRGYLDFGRLHRIHVAGAFFVTRAKKNTRMERRYSNPVDRTSGVIADQIVFLTGADTPEKYPDTLRRIKYRAPDGRMYVISHEQHFCIRFVDRAPLQKPLADRIVFQIDQATSQDQELLGALGERREDADLHRAVRLPHGGDYQKEARYPPQSLRNIKDIECVAVRQERRG